MRFFNNINDTFLYSKKYDFGTLILEKDLYGNELNKYLTVNYSEGKDNLRLYENLINYKTIYIPELDYRKYKPSLSSNLMNMQTEQLIIPIDLIDSKVIHKEELVPILEANSYTEYMGIINNRFTPFQRIILYSNTLFDWSNIIYDWKSRTERLTLILREKQAYLTNGVEPFIDIREVLPNSSIKDNFKDLEIIIIEENNIKDGGEEENNEFQDMIKELMKEELENMEDELKEKKKLLKDVNWVEKIYEHYRYTPNIYNMTTKSDWVVNLYNQYHPYKENTPTLIYINENDYNYSLEKGKKPMEINPLILPVLESCREYRKTYKELNK